jgi:hypothetical protein
VHFEDVSQVSLRDVTVPRSAGGLFSVALSVALRVAQALACASRCAPWRYQARCPVKSSAPHKVKSVPQDGVRTFLPPGHLVMTKPAITRPARHSYYTSENVRNLYLFPTEMKSTIRPMRVREAKDFLVAQTAEQAALESVSLSDLEKRMMCFTEGPGAPEDPLKLNEEFEEEYDTDEYEAKISRLLDHAYQRLRKEDDEGRRNWDDAIRCLRRGDHYLLVMWNSAPSTERRDSLKLLALGLGLAALVLLVAFNSTRFEPQWGWLQKYIPRPNPHLLFGVFVAFILAVFLFPRALGNALNWLVDKTLSRFLGPWKDEKDSG